MSEKKERHQLGAFVIISSLPFLSFLSLINDLFLLITLVTCKLAFHHNSTSFRLSPKLEKKKERKALFAPMDGTASPKLESEESPALTPEIQESKKRKMVQKTVVRVKVGENVSKLKNEGLPSDSWSWRKYGQKPIKGSPYPRGYYKCSTSKGCSAKKQVERCRTEASMLIVTYTSSHNHPAPELPFKESKTQATEDPSPDTSKAKDQEQEEEKKEPQLAKASDQGTNEENFHYLQSPIGCSEDIIIDDQEDVFKLNPEKTQEKIDPLLEVDPLCYSQLKDLSTLKSEELDYFDELEELPMSPSLLNLMRNNFSNERIPVAPS